MSIPLVTNRSLASAVKRFLSCSEITKSNARSMASVSVRTCSALWARLILTGSKRKCLCDLVLPDIRVSSSCQLYDDVHTIANCEHRGSCLQKRAFPSSARLVASHAAPDGLQ